MKTSLLSFMASVFFAAAPIASAAAGWSWATAGNSTPVIGNAVGTCAARNSAGSLITAGYFKGTVDFGNGNVLNSSGGEDIFIAFYDSSGVCQNAVGAIGLGDDGANAVAVDTSNNIYVTGYFNVTCDFGNGNVLIASGAPSDAFTAKYSSSGVCQWAEKISGSTNDSEGLGIFAYGSTIYVTGTAGGNTQQKLFIAQYASSTGSLAWLDVPSCTGNAQGTSITYATGAGAAVTGYFSGTITFSGSISLTSAGGYDIFIAEYDSSGACTWAKKAGGSGLDMGMSVAADATPYFYICGYFNDTCSFGNGIALTSFGTDDIFLAQYDQDGVCKWARKAGGPNEDQGFCLAVNPVSTIETQIFMTGAIRGPVDFGDGVTLDTGGLPSHCFIAEYDISGTCSQAVQIDGATSTGYGLAINKSAPMLYPAGSFSGTASFGGEFSISSTGITDSFLACYDATVPKTNLTMAVNPAGTGTTVPAVGTSGVTLNTPHPISAIPADGFQFVSWTATASAVIADTSAASTTATLSANATVTANFAVIPVIVQLTMAVNPVGGGDTTPPPIGPTAVTAGEPQQITATAAAGYQFAGWTATANAAIADSGSAATTATLAGDATVTANFALMVSLTMASAPAEGGTTSPSAGTSSVPAGIPQNISASAADGYTFFNWTATAGATIGNKNAPSTTATLSEDATVTANFKADVTLTMAAFPAEGGTTTPAPGSSKVPYGTAQSITAAAVHGYIFGDWTATAGATIGNKNAPSTTATLTADSTVTADFIQIPPNADLTMAANPAAAGTTVPAPGTSTVNTQEDIAIAADAAEGYVFSSWDATANAAVANKSAAATTVSIIGNSTVTANFAKTAVLTMAVSPADGGTTLPQAGASTVKTNTSFDITASPSALYLFSTWNAGPGATVDTPGSAHTTASISHDATITAVFVKNPNLAQIAFAVAPAGAGTTTPNVTLTVQKGVDTAIWAAANDGFTFVNWSASSAGAIFADVTSPNTLVSVIEDITVTANFLQGSPATDTTYGKIYELSVSNILWPSPEQTLADFAKKPKVYAAYTSGGKTKKTNLNLPDKFTQPVTEVTCEWNSSIPLLDKKTWTANKTLTTEEILAQHQPIIPLACRLFVSGQDTNGHKVKDVDTQLDLSLQPPTISAVLDRYGDPINSVSAGAGVEIIIAGLMFGKNIPAVWLEYKDSKGNVKQLKLKIDKEAFKFPNAKGKFCCMDINTGVSELTVLIPQQWPKNWQPGDHNIVIDNKICRATIPFQTQ